MNDITKELLNIMVSIDMLYQDGTIFNNQVIQDLKDTQNILNSMFSNLKNKKNTPKFLNVFSVY